MSGDAPIDRGFFMPAEWEPHARCWMAWPCRAALWGDGMMAAQVAYAEVARAIAAFEPVTMIARQDQVAEASLACGPGIDVLPLPIDDSWTRDTGPTFVVDGQGGVAGVSWQFNVWGDNLPGYDNDARLADELLGHLEAESFQAPFVLEGGSIHVDGAGTLITTEQCLLNPNRNPLLSRGEIEEHLMQFLGIRKVIWLGEGLEDDETDGHVDNVAAFVRPGMIVATMPADPADPNHRIMQDNVARLRGSRDAAGREIEVVELPQPARRENPNGTRQALSYVNFYIANGGIVMPGFEDPEDAKARAVLDKLFPDRQVVQVSGSDIVVGGGCIHCITQQQPAGDPFG